MLALAQIHLSMDNLEACQHQCLALLKMNKENDAATVVSVLCLTVLEITVGHRTLSDHFRHMTGQL